jgi:hypothetical protein
LAEGNSGINQAWNEWRLANGWPCGTDKFFLAFNWPCTGIFMVRGISRHCDDTGSLFRSLSFSPFIGISVYGGRALE